jgi:hypothetical protein
LVTLDDIGGRLSPSSVAAVLVAGAIAGCGSSGSSDNGVASKSANAILTTATNALESAKTVHVSGSVGQSGQSLTLDLSLVSQKGAKGTITQDGTPLRVIADGKYLYLNAGSKFWEHHAGTATAQFVQGKWLKTPVNGGFAQLSSVLSVQSFAKSLRGPHDTPTKGSTSTVNGHKVIAVRTQSGRIYVSTTGRPYPLRIDNGKAGAQHFDFGSYNASVALTPPAQSIDISKLQGK